MQEDGLCFTTVNQTIWLNAVEPMHDASEDEQEEFLNDADEKENSRKLKRERAERLRKMMDEEGKIN